MTTPDVRKPVERAAAGLFGSLSALRGKRIFHPRGEGFRADFDVDRPLRGYVGIPLFSERATHEATVRLSRALGLLAPLPDLLGLAFRIEPGQQDLLLVSSGRGPGARHLLVPRRPGFDKGTYSSILPYAIADAVRMVGALPLDERNFDVAVAGLRGDWEPFARLRLGVALPGEETERLEFNPWNTVPGVKPIGPLNGVRRSSYAGSQRGRARSGRMVER